MTAPHQPQDELLRNLDWVRQLAAQLVFDGHGRADLEQDLWHAVLHKPPERSVPLRAWFTAVGRNLVAMGRRGAARRQRREAVAMRPEMVTSTAELAERAELQQRLLAVVNALPEAMRDVVLLRYFEDLPPRAIALRLGVPVATVRTRLQRAQERLREQLDADFGDRRTWVLAFVPLARPEHVIGAAGAGATLLHVSVLLMKANKLVVLAAVLVVAAIPTWTLLSGASMPVPPDYGQATPVASLFDAPRAQPAEPAAAERVAAGALPPPDSALRGKVVDRDGAPVAGATLTMTPGWIYRSLVDQGKLRPADIETTSAADGTFVLPDNRRREWTELAVQHPDFVSVTEVVAVSAAAPAMIVMHRTHSVPLVVELVDRTTATRPALFLVTAVTSWRTGQEPEGRQPSRRLAMPNQERGTDGVFRGTARFLDGLPLEVRIECCGHGRGEWDDGTDTHLEKTLQPLPGQPLHLQFEVDLGGAERLATRVQRGRVLDARDDQPIAGVALAMFDETAYRRSVQSGTNGTFLIALPRGGTDGRLVVTHPDYQTLKVDAAPDTELTLRIARRSSLRCRIVDGNGTPLVGAPILFTAREPRTHERLRTDKNGEIFVERLFAARYHVYVLSKDGDPDERAIASDSWSLAADEQLVVTLQTDAPDAVRVMGTIVGGSPGLMPAFVPLAGAGSWVMGRPRDRGYDAGGLRRGEYLVLLVPDDGGSRDATTAVLPPLRVEGFGTMWADLLVPTGIVRGRVSTSRTDIASWRIVLAPVVPAGGTAAELVGSDNFTKAFGVPFASDGRFEVPRVANGEFRLEVREGTRVVAQRPVRVDGGLDLGDWQIDR